MHQKPCPPSHDAGMNEWCRWAWLVGRSMQHDQLPMLGDVICDQESDPIVRQTALGSYWVLTDVDGAIQMEECLLADNELRLALFGLQHPRWWHESSWIDVGDRWLGHDTELDQAVDRLKCWAQRPTLFCRIPHQIYDRVNISPETLINWEDIWRIGVEHSHDHEMSGFVSFWHNHITQWADLWYRWEEAIWLYRWRLQEEQQLVEWTHSEAYAGHFPEVPDVETVAIPRPQSAQESISLMILGLGFYLNASKTSQTAAAWDSIWSSWAASLNYALYETLSNVQTTEWHLGGLTGSLRGRSQAKRRGLQLD